MIPRKCYQVSFAIIAGLFWGKIRFSFGVIYVVVVVVVVVVEKLHQCSMT